MSKPRKGQAVKIYSLDQKQFIGNGKYIGSERAELMGMKIWMPRFKVGRKKYWGFECWWITEAKAKKIENGLEKRK